MPLSCIIYDLDGTLIDSAPDIALAANGIRKRYDLGEISEELIRTFIGDGAGKLIERALFGLVDDGAGAGFKTLPAKPERVASLITEFRQFYEEHPVVKTEIVDGVLDNLNHWQKEGVTQVCLTNKPHRITFEVLEKLDLLRFFDLVVGDGARDRNDRVLPRKPDTDVLDYVINETRAEKDKTVLVGDGRPDFGVSRAGGIPCIGLTCGYTAADVVRDMVENPELVAESFVEAAEILKRLNRSI